MRERLRTILRRTVCLLAFAPFLLLGPRVAPTSAEPEMPPGVAEIEHRLKTAGVTPELRARIHAAIRKATTYLLSVQRPDGAITGDLAGNSPFRVGFTSLAALALAHSGHADGAEGARRALRWLVPPKGKPRMKVTGGIYEGGIMAMLLKALDTRPDVAQRIVEQVIDAQDDDTAWWAYCTDDCTGCSWGVTGTTIFNLSTSQFAALALWAGALTSKHDFGKPLRVAWNEHLESLLRFQMHAGDWPYVPDNGGASPNSAAMGYANLLLCEGAMKDRLNEDMRLLQRVRAARRKGLVKLAKDGGALLDKKAFKGVLDVYGYYALEKACVFAGVQQLDGRHWYVEGAQRLLKNQRKTGSWAGTWSRFVRGKTGVRDDVVATSFALLFLLRVSETYRPTTPRDVPRTGPGPVITPSDGDKAAPPVEIKKAEKRHQVPLSKAQDLLKTLDQEVSRRTLRLASLEKVVRALDAAQRNLVSDGAEGDLKAEVRFLKERAAWRARLDELLAHGFKRCNEPHASATESVAVLIAETVGRGGAGAAKQLRSKLPRAARGRLEDMPSTRRYDAALRAVGTAGGPDMVSWLMQHISVKHERRPIRMTRAALLGLASVTSAPGASRRDAVRVLMKRLASLEKDAHADDDDLQAELDRLHWQALETRVIDALVNLCRDPETGHVPTFSADGGRPTLRVIRQWFKSHRNVRSAPWRDE